MKQWLEHCSPHLLAAVGTAVIVGSVVIWQIFADPVTYMAMLEPTLALLLVNLVATIGMSWPSLSLLQQRAVHAVQLASVICLALLLPIDFLQIYSIVWIAMAASLYPWRLCLLLLPTTTISWWCVLTFYWQDSYALATTLLYATFHLFALMTTRTAKQAEAARDQTQALYRELVATQHLLSEASRQSERTRIARDLHDLVGHHLTALSIHLQIAERQTTGDAQERIAQSRSLARLLLSDVRDAVTSLRDQGALDLRRALELLVDNVPQLAVRLDVGASVSVEDVDVADAIIRCVQEAITNSLRHGGASQSWVRVWQDSDGVHVDVRDDGQSADPAVAEGNGLTGMRERLLAVGGTLAVEAADDGFRLRADIPLAA
ncbi:MAG: sensor histidine kinase [Pseudomonadota bacterium]